LTFISYLLNPLITSSLVRSCSFMYISTFISQSLPFLVLIVFYFVICLPLLVKCLRST